MQQMPTAAILGASGYTGQETLDRVLAHPELEVVALGSDSLAGQPALGARRAAERLAAARSSRTTRRSPRGADVVFLCLGNDRGGRARAARRTRVVVDLSGAHRLADAALYPRVVRLRASAARSSPTGATRCPSSSRPTGR